VFLFLALPVALANPCGVETFPLVQDIAQATSAPSYGVKAAEALLKEGKHQEAMDAAHEAAERLRESERVPERLAERLIARMGKVWGQAKAKRDAARAAEASEGALSTPLLNQHASGSYPGGYCAITSLRMVMLEEGMKDPGADTVALQGARPYIPGTGSDPSLLASRARELGLSSASFKNTGGLSDMKAMLDAGKPVMIGGEGTFQGTFEDGETYNRTYRSSGHWMVAVGYETDSAGNITSVILNDPDTGERLTSSKSQFLNFFAPDGNIWMITY